MKSTFLRCQIPDKCPSKHEDTQPVAHELAHEPNYKPSPPEEQTILKHNETPISQPPRSTPIRPTTITNKQQMTGWELREPLQNLTLHPAMTTRHKTPKCCGAKDSSPQIKKSLR